MLSANHIHMWLAFPDEIQDAALLGRYRDLLSEDEQVQFQRFHFTQDAHRYLLTRALIRTTLSRYVPIQPAQWVFATNPFGKPAAANPQAMAEGLTFNVSHTKGLIALGVSKTTDLGVDVEQIAPPRELMELAASTMTKAELRTLAALAGANLVERFFQHWTLKESYIKARGMGLEIPVTQVGFEFLPPDRLALSLGQTLKDTADRWNLWQFRPTEKHWLAVCASRNEGHTQQLSWWKAVPLQSETPLVQAPVWTA